MKVHLLNLVHVSKFSFVFPLFFGQPNSLLLNQSCCILAPLAVTVYGDVNVNEGSLGEEMNPQARGIVLFPFLKALLDTACFTTGLVLSETNHIR